ncbi:ESX secretion-associated protein EspG [Nocardia sp. NBC_00511]|uniref:ESX secretion-associated protein EspG n=1 Tax=Nocardia sp. NBC_00511 TaxID=2903591 RepID=UPI002F912F14
MNEEPVAIDLNVDSALMLKHMAGLEDYPLVLALMPNITRIADRERVWAAVATDLTKQGIIDGDRIHPVIEHWLRCLERPDAELVARIIVPEPGMPTHGAMLRLSLVRAGDTHVLALRCDDHVVIQRVFADGERLDMLTAVLLEALGPAAPLDFSPFTVAEEDLATIPADSDERRRALAELGALPHTASLLTRAAAEATSRAEVLMVEYHDDDNSTDHELCLSVYDTPSGRFVAIPARSLDGRILSTYMPGDAVNLHLGVRALVDLLPARNWYVSSRM